MFWFFSICFLFFWGLSDSLCSHALRVSHGSLRLSRSPVLRNLRASDSVWASACAACFWFWSGCQVQIQILLVRCCRSVSLPIRTNLYLRDCFSFSSTRVLLASQPGSQTASQLASQLASLFLLCSIKYRVVSYRSLRTEQSGTVSGADSVWVDVLLWQAAVVVAARGSRIADCGLRIAAAQATLPPRLWSWISGIFVERLGSSPAVPQKQKEKELKENHPTCTTRWPTSGATENLVIFAAAIIGNHIHSICDQYMCVYLPMNGWVRECVWCVCVYIVQIECWQHSGSKCEPIVSHRYVCGVIAATVSAAAVAVVPDIIIIITFNALNLSFCCLQFCVLTARLCTCEYFAISCASTTTTAIAIATETETEKKKRNKSKNNIRAMNVTSRALK